MAPSAGQTAYRVDRDRYELRDLDLTDAERRALQVAVAAARTTEAEFGMFKLGGVADSSASITANLPQLELLPSLREAIAARATVAFRYHGAPRALQPYALLLREGFWYVIGHDLGHRRDPHLPGRSHRGFRRASGSGAEFERPAEFDAARRVPCRPEGARQRRPDWRSSASTAREQPLRSESSARSPSCVERPTARSRSRCRAAISTPFARGCSDGASTLRSWRLPTCATGWSTGCVRWRLVRDDSPRPSAFRRPAAPVAGDAAVVDGAW